MRVDGPPSEGNYSLSVADTHPGRDVTVCGCKEYVADRNGATYDPQEN